MASLPLAPGIIRTEAVIRARLDELRARIAASEEREKNGPVIMGMAAVRREHDQREIYALQWVLGDI